MKQLLFLITFLAILNSCDPQRTCQDPKCLYTDVNAEMDVSLTGKLDSVINVGDTVILSMKIPDTIVTNYGNIIFGKLWSSSFFGLTIYGLDTIKSTGAEGLFTIPRIITKSESPSTNAINWNSATREFECLIVATQKGKCIIEIRFGRIYLTDKDNKEWSLNLNFNVTNERRYGQYLSWCDSSIRATTYTSLLNEKGWYWFEVQ